MGKGTECSGIAGAAGSRPVIQTLGVPSPALSRQPSLDFRDVDAESWAGEAGGRCAVRRLLSACSVSGAGGGFRWPQETEGYKEQQDV